VHKVLADLDLVVPALDLGEGPAWGVPKQAVSY